MDHLKNDMGTEYLDAFKLRESLTTEEDRKSWKHSSRQSITC